MKILVTGASGFVGKAVVSHLTEKGHRVVPLASMHSTLGRLRP